MSIVPEPGHSFDLAHFRMDALKRDAAQFAARHGAGFLVLSSDGAGLHVSDRPHKTVAIELRGDSDQGWVPARFQVWPIQKSDRSLIERFISVGRTRRNDVVILDVSLSKFHAFFLEESGQFSVQDARSRNGTFVGTTRVSAQGEGPPAPLRSGDRVRFGAVELTFLDAAALQRLVRDILPA